MMYDQAQRNAAAAVYYPTMPPQMYWPLDEGSRGYVRPSVHCHGHGYGCCNHNYFPMSTPHPYHHHASPPSPSPSPFYPFCYPAAQGMHPPPYFPPYPYEKDISMGGHDNFRRWYPDHPSSGKQEDKKTNGSLLPFEANNYPYPIVWLQPDKENKKSDESRYNGRAKTSGAQAGENLNSFSQQPIIWNGWFPRDMSRVQTSNQEEEQKNKIKHNEEGAESQQPSTLKRWFPFDLSNMETMKQEREQGSNQHPNDVKKRNFPFPVFWMPYKPSVTESEKEPEKTTERDVSKKTTSGQGERPSHIINFQPLKHKDNKEKHEKYTRTEGSPNLPSTHNVVKIIPVKQLVSPVEGGMKTSSKTDDERKKKPLEDCADKESNSPQKTTKLSPVCLRVEPFSKRKVANGKSRSPSPRGDKRRADIASGKQDELIVLQNLQKNDGNDDQATAAREQADGQGGVKLGGTSGDTFSHECNEDLAACSDSGRKESERLEAKVTKTDAQSVTIRDSSDKAEGSKKVKFSDAEAATVIQAAYHGFEVRKLETLKKLKKLAEIKEQVAVIRTQIRALESCDVKNYDKQKIIITEMTMGLLLKLDTVQGLHTSIRDVRRSIAKELVSLQESLDAMVIRGKSSETQVEQPSGISFKGCMSNLKNEDISIRCRREDNIEIHDSSKIDHKAFPPVELPGKQVQETDLLPNPKELEESEAMVTREGLEEEIRNGPECAPTGYFPGASDSAAIVGNNKGHIDFQSPLADCLSDNDELKLGQLYEDRDFGREISNFENISNEQMGNENSGVFSLAVNDKRLYSKDISNDDPKEKEISGDAAKVSTEVDELISSNLEKVTLEESQEGSEECKEEEKITDGILSERPQEFNSMSVSPSEEKYIVDTPIEVPKESTEAAEECEADETTTTEIPKAPEKAGDTWEPDETVSQNSSERELQVDELPEGQNEQVDDDVQFEPDELQKEEHVWERDTRSESRSEIAVQQHQCLNGVSSLARNDLQIKIHKEDLPQGVDSLSEAIGYTNEKGVLLTTPEAEVIDGLRIECGDLANLESSVEEELHENDYGFGFVSDGSEVFPDFCIEKSEKIVNIAADEMENISPVLIPLGKMDATCLAPEDSEETQLVTGANNQADELDISLSSPTASEASLGSEVTGEIDRKLIEENEKLRDVMEKLLEAGSKQLSSIYKLSGRIDDLEKKLARKKKKQLKCRRIPKALLPRREVSV